MVHFLVISLLYILLSMIKMKRNLDFAVQIIKSVSCVKLMSLFFLYTILNVQHHKQILIQPDTLKLKDFCRCNLQERQPHLSVILLGVGVRGASLSGFNRKEFPKTSDEIWTGWFQQKNYRYSLKGGDNYVFDKL